MFEKMRVTSSSTLFVHVNTWATENAGMESARRSKSDTRKRGTQSAGLENTRISTMESQSPLACLQEAYACECTQCISLPVFEFCSAAGALFRVSSLSSIFSVYPLISRFNGSVFINWTPRMHTLSPRIMYAMLC